MLRNSLPQVPDKYIVSTFEVYQELEEIKVHKATGPDEIPNKILKELSHFLAEPICAIINSSIRRPVASLKTRGHRPRARGHIIYTPKELLPNLHPSP